MGLDGIYCIYYAFDLQGVIAVAVSDTPAGKYEFYGHVHYVDGTLLAIKREIPFNLIHACWAAFDDRRRR